MSVSESPWDFKEECTFKTSLHNSALTKVISVLLRFLEMEI